MPTKDPPHPGHAIQKDCLDPLGMTVTDAAKALGVSRNNLSMVLNGRQRISWTLAIRLSKAFGGCPEAWAGIQFDYDKAKALKGAHKIKVGRVPRPGDAALAGEGRAA